MIIKGAVLAKSTIDTTNLYALSTKSKWMHKFSLFVVHYELFS